MRWRCALVGLVLFTLVSSVRVGAQSADATMCRGSVDRKAVAGRVVDAATGAPVTTVSASLVEQHPDTDSNGYPNHPVFRRRANLDASGRFCFADVPAGDYRFQPGLMLPNPSHQAILIHLGSADSLQTITLRYRQFGRSPEEELEVATMLRALDANRRRWVRRRPPHYLLRVRRDCFWFCEAGPTYEVLDGVAIAAIDSAGARHALSGDSGHVTVDSLFDTLRASILDESAYVGEIEYDRRFGWPRHFMTDSRSGLSDVWAKMTVERFDVIK